MWDIRQWRHCIFSHEPRFSLYHSDGRVRVCRRQGERPIDACVQPNGGNRGPSVMVWGAIHHGGRNELVFGRNFVSIQDNAPPHTAHDTAASLEQHDVEVMDWPARSLDMNPIEHVWDQMAIWIRDMDNPPPP